jgi:L-lactate dehydrogenase complex protein LldF
VRPPPSVIPFHARVSLALADLRQRAALERASERMEAARAAAFAALPDAGAARARARAARLATLSDLPVHLERFEAAATAAGAQVHWARDGAEAAAIVVGIARARGARRIVKTRSMLYGELGLGAALAAAGLDVVESDLGEFVVKLAGEAPSHIAAPAAHMDRRQVGALFHERLHVPLTHDPQRLTSMARAHLRETWIEADMAITGASFGVAETGSLAIVSNQGNASLAAACAPVHVALLGVERMVGTLLELESLLAVLARSATGQKLSAYTDILTGPRRGDPDGPEALHVVIVDDGRSAIHGGPLGEILACIHCGACLSACPVYREIGGHAYASPYAGPLGAVLAPALGGLSGFAELPRASTLCGACRDACPVGIDLPGLLVKLRASALPRGERLALKAFRFLALRPRLFRAAIRVASALTRALAPLGVLRHLPPPLRGWTAQRDFPAFAARPFSAQLRELRRGTKR